MPASALHTTRSTPERASPLLLSGDNNSEYLLESGRAEDNSRRESNPFLQQLAATAAGATVISQVRYRFGDESPPGFTAVVLLDESHCSAHSYADLGLVALDIFTCGRANPRDILAILCEKIPLSKVSVQEVARFLLPDALPVSLAAAVAKE